MSEVDLLRSLSTRRLEVGPQFRRTGRGFLKGSLSRLLQGAHGLFRVWGLGF